MIQEEEIQEKETEQNLIQDKPKSKLLSYITPTSTADRLAYVALVIAIIFGYWGIRLTYRSIDTSVDLNHFDTLLKKTDKSISEQSKLLQANENLATLSRSQIDSLVSINKTLTNQFAILSKQYGISLEEQKLFNTNNANANSSNEAIFYIASQNIHLLIWQKHPARLSDWSLESKIDFLNRSETILNSQLSNPYLLSNRYMLNDWLNVRDSVFWYMQDIQIMPQQAVDSSSFGGLSYSEIQSTLTREWRNCYLGVANLGENIEMFMRYYRFRGGVFKKPANVMYETIRKLQVQ